MSVYIWKEEVQLLVTQKEWQERFGNNLDRRIRMSNITKKEFADKLNIDNVQLSRYINGHVMPTAYTLYKMTKLLNCTMDELLADTT